MRGQMYRQRVLTRTPNPHPYPHPHPNQADCVVTFNSQMEIDCYKYSSLTAISEKKATVQRSPP